MFLLEDSILFGRAAHADVQIVDDAVSRQHARLEVDADGTVLLLDLRSKEGTFVDGEPVQRRVLEIGDRFRIGQAHYVLERIDNERLCTAPVFEFKTQGRDTLVATRVRKQANVRLMRVPTVTVAVPRGQSGSAAAKPAARTGPIPLTEHEMGGARAEALRELRELLGAEIGLDDPQLDEGIRGTAGSEVELDPQGQALVIDPSTLEALVQYRALRHRLDQGDNVKEYDRLRLQALERRFREGDLGLSANRRQWRRFHCAAPGEATLFRNLASRTIPIRVADLGAGGLRFFAPDLAFSLGDVLSVLMPIDPTVPKQAVFSARIVWVNQVAFSFGATFCGAARLEQFVQP